MKKTSFLILAAGDGKRIKSKIPKFLLKVKNKSLIIWQLEKISKYNFKIYIFIQPKHLKYLDKIKTENPKLFKNTEVIFQTRKKGLFYAMEEAISKISSKYIVAVWCDQILISSNTYNRLLNNYNKLVLPIVKTKDLYIQIKINKRISVHEKNEGAKIEKEGLKDLGLFKLDNNFFQKLFKRYKNKIPNGKISGEKNFLQLFKFIALKEINFIKVKKDVENIGINTRSDANKVRQYLS